MINIKRYEINDTDIWNNFNKQSKTPLFMFDRGYMDYHKDRFIDHSLLFYDDNNLIALLPLCEKGNSLYSHGGLTYGGFITNSSMKQKNMMECFDALLLYASHKNFSSIEYKKVPHIYQLQCDEEDKYCLFRNNAIVSKIEPSSCLRLDNPIKMSKGRKSQISRAKREGVVVEECFEKHDYNRFINLENEVLSCFHNTRAVHSGEELFYLYRNFPNNIHLFCAKYNNEMISGIVLYEYENVIHTQYMAADVIARKIGALDLIIFLIIEKYKNTKQWLDFGISTERAGKYLNEGLIFQKESFGGRTCSYETWEIHI